MDILFNGHIVCFFKLEIQSNISNFRSYTSIWRLYVVNLAEYEQTFEKSTLTPWSFAAFFEFRRRIRSANVKNIYGLGP